MNINEKILEVVTYSVLLASSIFAFASVGHYFYKGEKDKEIVRKFITTKGIFYFALAVTVFCYDGLCKKDLTLTTLLTICLAIFETAQNIMQAKEEGYFEKANKLLKNIEIGDIKKIEILHRFCIQKIDLLESNASISKRKLIYEQIYDYLKYYEEAKEFLDLFKLYIESKKELEDIIKSESEWFENFKYECIEVVKLPEIY